MFFINSEVSSVFYGFLNTFFYADVLLYVSEGLFPFLQVFYNDFYSTNDYDQQEVEGGVSGDVYKALLVSSDQLL